ncbi:MAG TPA: polyphenol oxidase family protein [Gemmatimonadaceae bacterium]|nr:polyphenol oxidase family protein [Gemmatimonadaceae bacterium]
MLAGCEAIDDFAPFGVQAFVTGRATGSFNTSVAAPVGEVMGRWYALVDDLAATAPRFASARQVHGDRVVVHRPGWDGWLRVGAADGHVAPERGTALAITIADCVPIFIAHPSGAVALLHSGWRGTAAGMLDHGIEALAGCGLATRDLALHLGPAICGSCYEVSPDVYRQLTGTSVSHPTCVDLRALLAARAEALGVRQITTSRYCTRCDNDRFYSHRAGDKGRQVAVIVGCKL